MTLLEPAESTLWQRNRNPPPWDGELNAPLWGGELNPDAEINPSWGGEINHRGGEITPWQRYQLSVVITSRQWHSTKAATRRIQVALGQY